MPSKSWRLQTREFLLQKEGAEFSECEDAIGVNHNSLRYAVADGATEAFDSGNWARQLTTSWVEAGPSTHLVNDFRSWVAEQGERLHASWDGRALAWYAEEKARHGSFAAFVGVQFEALTDSLRWEAVALGDSCLVHRRDDCVCSAIPLSDHQSFTSCPALVPSLQSLQEAACAKVVIGRGAAKGGDVFLLLSDAVAAWYLKSFAEGDFVTTDFDSLLAASRSVDLSHLLRRERLANRLKDDDVAVLRIAVERA